MPLFVERHFLRQGGQNHSRLGPAFYLPALEGWLAAATATCPRVVHAAWALARLTDWQIPVWKSGKQDQPRVLPWPLWFVDLAFARTDATERPRMNACSLYMIELCVFQCTNRKLGLMNRRCRKVMVVDVRPLPMR